MRFTDILAETVLWEFSFFIRNYKEMAFLKKFQTSIVFSSESTLMLSAAWVVLQSKQSMFQRIFLKKPFQAKSPWNGPFAFSLGKLWLQFINVFNFKMSTRELTGWYFVLAKSGLYSVKTGLKGFELPIPRPSTVTKVVVELNKS